MDWLTEIVQQHAELESPIAFWRWSALTAMSAVLKDQVWMDKYLYKLYPNVYTMLHADSGLKKGPPVNMAKKLVNMVGNTRVITGRSSIQAILKDMGTAKTSPGGKINTKSTAFICSSELSSSIVGDPVAAKILTDLYDRNYNEGEWRSLLKAEVFTLKDPTLSMLTATNDAMSEDFFNKSVIQGGYFARTFIIHEHQRNRGNSLTYPLRNPPDYEKSAKYLKGLTTLAGPFSPFSSDKKEKEFEHKKIKDGDRVIWFDSAGKLYDDWYDDFLNMMDNMESKDDTGTMNRFPDSVLKIAMLLSLSERPVLSITESAMNEAINICEKLLGNVRKTTLGRQGMSNTAMLKTLILNEFLTRETHSVTRTILSKKMFMHYSDISEFDSIMGAFEASGLIRIEVNGPLVIYTMPATQVKELREYLAGKSKEK